MRLASEVARSAGAGTRSCDAQHFMPLARLLSVTEHRPGGGRNTGAIRRRGASANVVRSRFCRLRRFCATTCHSRTTQNGSGLKASSAACIPPLPLISMSPRLPNDIPIQRHARPAREQPQGLCRVEMGSTSFTATLNQPRVNLLLIPPFAQNNPSAHNGSRCAHHCNSTTNPPSQFMPPSPMTDMTSLRNQLRTFAAERGGTNSIHPRTLPPPSPSKPPNFSKYSSG